MQDGLIYLNSLGLHKVKPGLERIKSLLDALGNPQDKVRSIIIAGTNGKGSVAAAISSILSEEGYSTGLYTSPHLVNITERIKINGKQISESELSSIILEIKKTSEETLSEQPSYFEVITGAAFVYFAREKADFSVLEVGMGGRWDATNVIAPLVSVITNISLEHTDYLGATVREIASEKACVIKPGVSVVTAAENGALEVITNSARENNSHLLLFGRDFNVEGKNSRLFNYKGVLFNLEKLHSNLDGEFQLNNMAIAIAAIELVKRDHGVRLNEQAVRNGLSSISWDGRFEIIREEPPIILDSAHNPGAAKALVKSIRDKYPGIRFTFLIGMLNDKGHGEFFREISLITGKLIITKVPSERAAQPIQLLSMAEKYIDKIEIIQDYKTAFSKVMKSDEPSCVTGSLYLIGAVKNLTA